MKQTGIFMINGVDLELPLFKEGDRVTEVDSSLLTEKATGTVNYTTDGGLFVDVRWDKPSFPGISGGTVELGSRRLVDSIKYIKEGAII
jgi:hypothetical protein